MHSRYALSQTHCFDLSMVGHSEILLSKCAQFRQEGEFIDVYLKVREEVFSAHRSCLENRVGFHLQRRSSSER